MDEDSKTRPVDVDADPWNSEEAAQDLKNRQAALAEVLRHGQERATAVANENKREGSRTPRRGDKEEEDSTDKGKPPKKPAALPPKEAQT